MEIKAETFKDKIYTHFITYLKVYLFSTLTLSFVLWGISMNVDNMHKREALEIEKNKQFKIKVAKILKDKPQLVCNKKSYLTADEYDITEISNVYYVVTQKTKDTPLESSTIGNCQIIDVKTKTMVEVKPIVIPIDEQHKKSINALNETITKLNRTISNYSLEKQEYVETLITANKQILELKKVMKQQDKELRRLTIVEAQYTDVKSLLTIVLNKKDINLKDLVVEETKPQVVAVKVEKVLKESNQLVVNVPTPLTGTIDSDKVEHLKRLMYALKELAVMFKSPKNQIRIPSKLELDEITITEAQKSNASHAISQLTFAVDGVAKIYAKKNAYDEIGFRNSIRTNIGI